MKASGSGSDSRGRRAGAGLRRRGVIFDVDVFQLLERGRRHHPLHRPLVITDSVKNTPIKVQFARCLGKSA